MEYFVYKLSDHAKCGPENKNIHELYDKRSVLVLFKGSYIPIGGHW